MAGLRKYLKTRMVVSDNFDWESIIAHQPISWSTRYHRKREVDDCSGDCHKKLIARQAILTE